MLRPEAIDALQGVDRIIHAGDIGDPAVLSELRRIAPVTAVRGNNDRDAWAARIAERRTLRVEGVRILVLHDVNELRGEAAPAADVVVAGHSHRPLVDARDGVLYVNPGSAGPRRFKLPVSVALLAVSATKASAEVIVLG